MARGACAFCQNEATLTGEHIWSNWINELLPPASYFVTRLDGIKNIRTDWSAPNLNLKAKVVCGNCNSGWMNDIENEVRPIMSAMILNSGNFCLMPSGIQSLASFAFKTSVIADHMNTTRKPFFLPSVRQRFCKERAIPPRVQMWLGTFQFRNVATLCRTSYDQARGGGVSGLQLYTMTYTVRHLLFQVLSYKGRPSVKGKFIQDPNMNNITPEFWPSKGNVVILPTTRRLGEDGISDFVERWKHLFTLRRR